MIEGRSGLKAGHARLQAALEKFREQPEVVTEVVVNLQLQVSLDMLEECWVKKQEATRFLDEYMKDADDGSHSL